SRCRHKAGCGRKTASHFLTPLQTPSRSSINRSHIKGMTMIKTIVTGGAGSIGKAVARCLLQEQDHHILLVDIDADRLESTKAELASPRVEVMVSHIENPQACAAVVAACQGSADNLVHMAGVFEVDPPDIASHEI